VADICIYIYIYICTGKYWSFFLWSTKQCHIGLVLPLDSDRNVGVIFHKKNQFHNISTVSNPSFTIFATCVVYAIILIKLLHVLLYLGWIFFITFPSTCGSE